MNTETINSMTIPATSRPALLAPTEISDGIVGFGLAEIGFLILHYTEADSARAFAALRLDADYFTQPVVLSGASSLVARGLAISTVESSGESSDATLTLAGPAALLGFCLARAERWTSMAFLKGEGDGDAAFFIQTSTMAVLLQPRAIGTWFALFKTPQGSSAELIDLIVKQNLSAASVHTICLGTSTLVEAHDLFVRVMGDGRWALASVDSHTQVTEEAETDDAGLRAVLEQFLSVEG